MDEEQKNTLLVERLYQEALEEGLSEMEAEIEAERRFANLREPEANDEE